MENYYLLTGTSGSGKTSLIKSLQSCGYSCSEESARKILTEQLRSDGPGLPSKDPSLFTRMMKDYSIAEYIVLQKIKKPVFFDRGLPDMIAYAVRFGIDLEEFHLSAQKYRYSKFAFICPPWRDIFVNDSERKGTFDMYSDFHKIISNEYRKLNYDLIELPFCSVEERKAFVLDFISNQ